jgi:two-component system cell cycle response regulator DivK
MLKRVLICDDDSDILSICQFILEELGLEVHTRNNCNNIVSVVEEIKPDVILMDNWIPDTGGIIATRTLKQHPIYKKIPVIYFSANTDIKLLARDAGADSYLAKPFDINDLEKAIAFVRAS